MAEVQQKESGDGKKGKPKKMHIHVDFTPMVDMNMLLITFFMLCTTMIKSQTLQIALPSNEKVEQEQQNKTKQSEAITLILDTERDADGNVKIDAETGKPKHTVYYYEGKPVVDDENKDGIIDNPNIKVEKFIGNSNGEVFGIRKILHNRNKQVLEKINVQKEKWRNKELSDEEYQDGITKLKEIGAEIISINTEITDVSSTQIREELFHGKNSNLIDTKVKEYIFENNLYKHIN